MAAAGDPEFERIPIVLARAMLTQLPELLADENRAVALTRGGKPVLAVMPWDLFQSIVETMQIMGGPDMTTALRQGIRDLQHGNLVSLDEVRTELGIID